MDSKSAFRIPGPCIPVATCLSGHTPQDVVAAILYCLEGFMRDFVFKTTKHKMEAPAPAL